MTAEGVITSMGPVSIVLIISMELLQYSCPELLCYFLRYCQMDALLHPRRENVSPKIKTLILIYKVHGNIFSVIIIIEN